MAEQRKVPFVTISSFNNNNAPPAESKKRRREDEAEISLGEDVGGGSAATGPGGGMGASPFGNVKAGDGDSAETKRVTVRLNIPLPEPSERGSAEFNYSELVQSTQVKKLPAPGPPKVLKPALDPYDPFAESGDDEEERREVEAPAKKFESKNSQGNTGKKKKKIKRKDVMQDLIDMGFVFDDTDPFINNSEAVKKLPAPGPPKVLKPALDPYDPFAESGDDEEERREVEAPAKKFESKNSQGNTGKKKKKIKRKDVMQDLIDMGFGYIYTDPFINNSEAVKKLPAPGPPKVLKPALDPYDPFAESGDDEEERREVEAPAKKFESKNSQGNTGKKKKKIKRKDVMQDLIDMGFVFDDTDPFINNSEAVKKLPAPGPPKVLKPALDPYDPFAESGDDEEERREVEAPAKKFESKNSQGNTGKKKKKIKRKDVMQDLIDMGFVFDDTDPFINNSEAVKKLPAPGPPKVLKPALDPYDPFAESGDDEEERREVEAPAKKFESKYSQGNTGKKKRKDRVQDLIDIGFGYDDTDPFIDNSEAYDELVPASLNTKLGGFYINTGTLQFRAASESEGEDFKKLKDGEERVIKKRRKKQDGSNMDEKKPRKIRKPKQGVSGLNAHRPEKKKRKKLMKDSLNLAAMLRRFPREENRKKNPGLPRGQHNANSAMLNAHPKPNDNSMADLANDPAMMSLLGSANDCEILQYVMGDLDFGLLDSPQPSSPAQGENGAPGRVQGRVQGAQGGLLSPPPLPNGLPAPLNKRIEDLRVASHQFDQEGRKKFFTLDMNNILLDIELQVQEQPAAVRSSVYSHLEAFVPCNKEALLKRLKKLSLNIQDDRLRAPLLKLKLAVCSMMPEQIARYNMDCIAKVAKQQSEEGEKNGSEEEDEEKPGKRVMGPRKKFVWDEKLRMLLCNLVRVKLGCYELEGQSFLSPEDYLKAFMENEVKLLWPKGWMQARILFKESLVVHGHLTGNTAKKKMVPTPRSKPKEGGWVQRSTPSVVATPSPAAPVACRPSQSPAEPICLLDSLDDELTAPALDSISQALVLLSNAAKGLVQGDSPPSPDGPKTAPSSLHASPLLQKHKKSTINTPSSNTPLYISTSSSPSSLSRPPTVSPSLSLARSEGLGSMKVGGALAQAHRQSVLSTQRPAGTGLSKANAPGSHSQPKPRLPPNQKGFGSNNTKANSGDTLLSSPSPSFSHSLSGAQAQKQSNFITPMQATLTKSSHSSTSPIIKLTPRLPNPSTSTTYSSPSPNPRTQAASSMHQYSSKSPAGFRPPFSGPPGGPAKLAQGSYTPPGGQKTPSQITSSSANTNLTNTSSISKHSGSSPSPTIASTNQRQRPAGGTLQGAKPIKSVSTQSVSSQLPQVSSASSSLLGSAPSLPRGFGMLGGLVPVSLPFQFPSLLNLPPLGGTAGSSTGASGSSASNNSAFSLTQNLLKSLQSGSQVALPPHLQLAFSDVNQTQGGDVKRKSL